MKQFLFILLLATAPFLQLRSQISISSDDFWDIYAPGNTFLVSADSSGVLNIGNSGGPNNWDFSDLSGNLLLESTVVNVSGTPFQNAFPTANTSLFNTQVISGSTVESWSYSKLTNSGLFALGSGFISTDMGNETQILTTFSGEGDYIYSLPLQYPKTWGTSGTDTVTTVTSLNGIPMSTLQATFTTQYQVDAYGTMILPEIGAIDALRIIHDRISFTELAPGLPPVRSRSRIFQFIAKTGQFVSLETLTDTLTTSGSISGGINWTVGGPSGIVDKPSNPKFSLEQNHPNPFKLETTFTYHLFETARVELAVFNLLGIKVSVLVNETQDSGTHQIKWLTKDQSGKDLPEGIYMYRLSVGNQSVSQKMVIRR